MRRSALLGLALVIVLLGGCTYLGLGKESNSTNTTPTGDIVLDDEFVSLNETDTTAAEDEAKKLAEDVEDEDVAFTVDVVEGDLVKLDLNAKDPDGDSLTYTFSEPLNAQGRWQTDIGDEGRYLITVTATDGKLSTSEDVLIVVGRANRPPVIECPDTITIKETELLMIDCNIYDEEGDRILISYEGWTTSSSKRTTYDDAGEYTVLLRATDSKKTSTESIDIIVENVNRPSVISPISDMTIMETSTVSLKPEVSDPDGDPVKVSFSSPLDKDGEWLTTDGDAGEYKVVVTASDGQATTTQEFTITVTQINTAPVLKPIMDIVVDEGDLIEIPVNAYDPEGDKITMTYSGFMDSDSYQTTYDDSGSYEQTVVVSDGVLSTSQTFTVTVKNKNRAPEFVFPKN